VTHGSEVILWLLLFIASGLHLFFTFNEFHSGRGRAMDNWPIAASYLFPGAVVLYGWFYNGFKDRSISQIYQTDKYGIVLTYGILCFLRILSLLIHMNQHAARRWIEIDRLNQHADRACLDEVFAALFRQLYTHLDDFARLIIVCGLKVLSFNFVLKNHTSHIAAQSHLHLLLIVPICFCTFYIKQHQCDINIQTMTIMALPRLAVHSYQHLFQLACAAVCGLVYLYADRHFASTVRCNVLIVVAEAMAVHMTI